MTAAAAPRDRGVRLSELDRSVVYRLGWVAERRRWEVLGSEVPRGAGAVSGAGAATAAEPRAAYVPRHAGPAGHSD